MTSSPPTKRPWTRRRFIKMTIAGVATAGFAGYRGGFYTHTHALRGLRHLSPTTSAILYAIIDTILPPDADRKPATLRRHVVDIDRYITGIPGADRRQLILLLYLVEHTTLPFGPHISRFSRLSHKARTRTLQHWQTSSIGLVRLGLQSLKTLVFLAYYRTPEAFRSIGYTGPIAPGFQGPPASRARYDRLLAPPNQTPSFPQTTLPSPPPARTKPSPARTKPSPSSAPSARSTSTKPLPRGADTQPSTRPTPRATPSSAPIAPRRTGQRHPGSQPKRQKGPKPR